jgi:hypothetical protein
MVGSADLVMVKTGPLTVTGTVLEVYEAPSTDTLPVLLTTSPFLWLFVTTPSNQTSLPQD